MMNFIKSYKSKGDPTILPPFPEEYKDKIEDDLEIGSVKKEVVEETQPYRIVKFLVYIRDYFKK